MTRNVANQRGKVTSFYLDEGTQEKLDALAAASNLSRSLVVRNLIQQAGAGNKPKMRKLVAQLSDLLDAT